MPKPTTTTMPASEQIEHFGSIALKRLLDSGIFVVLRAGEVRESTADIRQAAAAFWRECRFD